MRKFLVFTLTILFLLGCGACANGPTPPDSISIDGSYTLVSPESGGATALQAAQCIQATLEHKMKLPALKVTREDPGSKAIVFSVDSTMDTGSFQVTLRGTSVYLTAQDTNILLLVTRQLQQRMLENGNPVVTQQMCEQLTGKYELSTIPFRFVSQNILSKDVAGGNTVEDRQPRFKALMQEYCPDIVGIQEYSTDWETYINSEFGEVYTEISPATQALLLRKSRYEVQDSGFFYLSPTPDVRSQFEGDSGPRTCIWAIATDKLTKTTFLILNCHPDWNNDSQRALQVEVIFSQMGEKMHQYPTLFCGDFNTLPTGPVYSQITQNVKDASTNTENNLSDVDYTYHNFGKSSDLIDYIFYTEPFKPIAYRIISDMYKGQVSDHYGIMADFMLE